jgi:hypothetical protein
LISTMLYEMHMILNSCPCPYTGETAMYEVAFNNVIWNEFQACPDCIGTQFLSMYKFLSIYRRDWHVWSSFQHDYMKYIWYWIPLHIQACPECIGMYQLFMNENVEVAFNNVTWNAYDTKFLCTYRPALIALVCMINYACMKERLACIWNTYDTEFLCIYRPALIALVCINYSWMKMLKLLSTMLHEMHMILNSCAYAGLPWLHWYVLIIHAWKRDWHVWSSFQHDCMKYIWY